MPVPAWKLRWQKLRLGSPFLSCNAGLVLFLTDALCPSVTLAPDPGIISISRDILHIAGDPGTDLAQILDRESFHEIDITPDVGPGLSPNHIGVAPATPPGAAPILVTDLVPDVNCLFGADGLPDVDPPPDTGFPLDASQDHDAHPGPLRFLIFPRSVPRNLTGELVDLRTPH